MNSTIDAKIEALEAKLKQAKALRSKQAAAERAKAAKADRAADTRRKVLLGAFVLEQLEREGTKATSYGLGGKQFSNWLTRPDDRALFDLHADTQQP